MPKYFIFFIFIPQIYEIRRKKKEGKKSSQKHFMLEFTQKRIYIEKANLNRSKEMFSPNQST